MACKRCSFLYFQNFMGWDDELSTAIYHTFVTLCYLIPILEVLITDSGLEKFRMIVSLPIVYTTRQVVTAISSSGDLPHWDSSSQSSNISIHVALSMISMILIVLGTGDIKHVYQPLVGISLKRDQEKEKLVLFHLSFGP